jgi:carbamoylphosphate synthase large subunit
MPRDLKWPGWFQQYKEEHVKSFLVTGIGGPAGQNVANLLLGHNQQVAGTDVRVITLPGVAYYPVPPANAPDFLSAIHGIAERTRIDLIIPTVSEELPVFASAWNWQEEFPVLVSSAEAIRVANDKYLTASVLSASSVSVPRFCLPSQLHSSQELGQKIGWPCISKPRVGRGGREVTWHPQQDWPAIAALGDGYILQEFAPGTDFAPNIYLGRDGNATAIVLEKTELKEGIVGNAKSVRRVDAADVADLACAAARAVGLFGPLDIDIRRRSDGIPVVLEINARFGANIRYAPEVLESVLRDLNKAA